MFNRVAVRPLSSPKQTRLTNLRFRPRQRGKVLLVSRPLRLSRTVVVVSLLIALFFAGAGAVRGTEAKETFVYVGTYTGEKSKGIYLFRLQTQNLEVSQNITLVPLGLAAQTPSPS